MIMRARMPFVAGVAPPVGTTPVMMILLFAVPKPVPVWVKFRDAPAPCAKLPHWSVLFCGPAELSTLMVLPPELMVRAPVETSEDAPVPFTL